MSTLLSTLPLQRLSATEDSEEADDEELFEFCGVGSECVQRRERDERGETARQSEDRISGEGQARRPDEDDRMI